MAKRKYKRLHYEDITVPLGLMCLFSKKMLIVDN